MWREVFLRSSGDCRCTSDCPTARLLIVATPLPLVILESPCLGRGRGSQVRRPAGACHPFNQRRGMALTIVETCAVTGGAGTHADTHVAAALDPIGGLPGVKEFPVTPAGYACLLGWLGGFGTVCLVGIEGTGSYGAGLSRHVTAAGIRVVEV